MAKDKKIKVTLMKSLIGRKPAHKACAAGLGLKHIRQSVEVVNTPDIQGMLEKVSYLVQVEEL